MSANPSDSGADNHTPLVPRNKGRTSKNPSVSAKVLKKEIIAEIFPFDRAVKKTETKMFIPAKR